MARPLVALSSIERRVVCILEDLHSADGETLAVLDYLFDRLDGTALMFVATMRRHEQPATDATVDEWVRRGAEPVRHGSMRSTLSRE